MPQLTEVLVLKVALLIFDLRHRRNAVTFQGQHCCVAAHQTESQLL